jgi:hypothetical protein
MYGNSAPGRAAQVHPIKPVLKLETAWNKALETTT